MTTALATILAALEKRADLDTVERRGHWLTGGQFLDRIGARAADLPGAGLKPGETALIVVSDNMLAMETLFGCWMRGIAGAFVDFRTPPRRISDLAQHLGAARIIGQRPVNGLDIWLARDGVAATDHSAPNHIDPAAGAIVYMSSGTTGPVKTYPRTQENLSDALAEYCAMDEAMANSRMLSAISVAYSASAFQWLRSLANGTPIVAMDLVYRLQDLDAALRRKDITHCGLPPNLIRRLAALPDLQSIPRYPQLMQLSSIGGPALAQDKIAAVTRLSENYRMTYSCVGIGMVSQITGTEILERPASCGKVREGVQVTILDGQRRCAPGEIGELLVSSGTGPAKRPGDLGWLDRDGYLYLTGRVQGMFCRNGVNFSADRLVSAALDLPQIAAAAAISEPDGDQGDIVHLFVQAENGQAEGVRRHLIKVLPSAEQPDHVHIRRTLPMNVAGKVDLRELARDVRGRRKEGLSDASL